MQAIVMCIKSWCGADALVGIEGVRAVKSAAWKQEVRRKAVETQSMGNHVIENTGRMSSKRFRAASSRSWMVLFGF